MNLYEIDFAVLGLIQLQAASKQEAEQLAHDELAFLETGGIKFGNCELLEVRDEGSIDDDDHVDGEWPRGI
jgi:ABC-type uncharacterized transport system ATPase subunit